MTWENRLRLLGGITAVIVAVFALTLVFNHRQNQITSFAAVVTADTYSIGADHAGTVTSQLVKEGDQVVKGQQLFTVQSLQLKQDMANGLEAGDTQAYKVDAERGTLTYYAVTDGRINELKAHQGNSVPAGGELATLTGGERYVAADFQLVPRDYARVRTGYTARIILPNDQVVSGIVTQIAVASGVDGTVSRLRIAAPEMLGLSQASLAEPGAPVIVTVQLADISWFAPVTDAMNDLLLQVGLR